MSLFMLDSEHATDSNKVKRNIAYNNFNTLKALLLCVRSYYIITSTLDLLFLLKRSDRDSVAVACALPFRHQLIIIIWVRRK